ncbi:MAG: UDP-3-O-(3-hydroxymyristoyl)glucosamine N-acyltransferase [Deltaproteobacteria bacterium]|nr:UDP-3-O-(3-hydroxymyristoyl)glucosamine N-acyltransferase [Deltaproteobacteria bacterium]
MGSEIRLSDLAARIGARLAGDGDVLVTGVAPIEEAGPGHVTFLANPKYARRARESRAAAIIAREPVEGALARFLLCENPYYAFACAVEIFHPPARPEAGVSERAFVHPAARIGREVSIAPFAVVEEEAVIGDRTAIGAGTTVGRGVAIGEDCLIYPRVTLYRGVRVGSRVILHAGCVIGSDGFGFAPTRAGYKKIPQVGTVEIGDDVEIGANTTIDRAALGVTRIGRGTKLDNLIQVGHNVEIGRDTVIAAQAGISGSCRVGDRVMIGGQAGLAGHLDVGDGVMLGAQSGVAGPLSASESPAWSGSPAMPHAAWLRMSVLLPKLPELFRRVRRIEEAMKKGGED